MHVVNKQVKTGQRHNNSIGVYNNTGVGDRSTAGAVKFDLTKSLALRQYEEKKH